jgi:hypothetical protein
LSFLLAPFIISVKLCIFPQIDFAHPARAVFFRRMR